MEQIKAFFDDFTFSTRLMPVLTWMLPIIGIGIYEKIIDEGMIKNTLYLSIIIIFMTFMSYIARNLGKKVERNMVKRLGALPTTILMRFSDDRIDRYSKERYHKVLKSKIKGLNIPLNLGEENSESDEIYDSAINWLRNTANLDKKKYVMVYNELKAYNYWRNLYGSKYIFETIYILIAIREVVIINDFNVKDIFLKPYPEYLVFIIIIISIFLTLSIIRRKNVENKAFDYAKALIEVCEKL
ncbi:hypothetical protein CCS79_13550 [Clostridium diolis]|uniref:hypothetical protein n=1 Tax=Clostridium diolis TaxID=223919 RepID=UPI000B3FC68A|nr:hypothetical protein [Clostridium diolis]OVE67975.1 hypothetical protein CCS79_13550 [Clostridium diolis]